MESIRHGVDEQLNRKRGLRQSFFEILRRQKDKNQSLQNAAINGDMSHSAIIQAGGDINFNLNGSIAEIVKLLDSKNIDRSSINIFLEEKADDCKNAILRSEVDCLKKICESLCISGFVGCDDKLRSRFQFYRYILSLMEHEDADIQSKCMKVLNDEYKKSAEYLLALYRCPDSHDISELFTQTDEIQACALSILFGFGQCERILSIYDLLDNKEGVPFYWKYFVGISLFNVQRFEESCNILRETLEYNEIKGSCKRDSVELIAYLADMQRITIGLSRGKGEINELGVAYSAFCKFKDGCDYNKAVKGNEILVAEIELQTILNINRDVFWDTYNTYSSEIQKSVQVLNLLGTYYELLEDYTNVYEIYSQLDWRHTDLFLFKMMFSRFAIGNFQDILRLYEKAGDEVKSSRVKGLWLAAIKELHPDEFERELASLLDNENNSIQDTFSLTLGIQPKDHDLFERLIYPKMETLTDGIIMSEDSIKIGYAGMFLQFGFGGNALYILKALQEPGIIDDLLAMEFYQNLYFYKDALDKTKMSGSHGSEACSFIADNVSVKEKIADWFINYGILKANFLTIKINCLYDRGKIISAIDKSKELYGFTKDENVAANIISLMCQNPAALTEGFKFYADVLKNSSDLRCIIASAIGYEKIGLNDEAGFQSYKAIYKLNGADNYEVFDSCFSLFNRMIAYHYDDVINKERITGNVVVELKTPLILGLVNGENEDSDETVRICLDNEERIADYGEERNHSMGIDHFGPKDSMYIWLQGRKVGEYVSYKGREYRITEIVDRYAYMSKYVFSKIVEGKGKSNIPVKTITVTDMNDFKKQILDFKNSKPQINAAQSRKNLMDMYHSITDGIGLPIESIISCDYTDYIELIRGLLYLKDEALYAGEAALFDDYVGDYVMSLPSLVLICLFDAFDIFDDIKEQLVVADSLKSFIKSQVNKNTEMQTISPGKLITAPDGTMRMMKKEDEVVDVWRKIYEYCENIKTDTISNLERESFRVVDNIDAEKFFIKMKFDICQLDTFILSARKSAVLIMDDLFFRKLAERQGICTTNFTFRLFGCHENRAASIAMKMSKSNYILTPIIYKGEKDGMQLWKNLLEGKIKNSIYGRQLKLVYQRHEQMKDVYGNSGGVGLSTVVETVD